MSRRYKIRRNQKIYSGPSRRHRWKIAGFVGILLLVFLLGWSLYQPIYNFVTGRIPAETSSSGSSGEASGSQDPSGPSQSASQSASASQSQPAEETKTKGVYLPASALTDLTQLESTLADLSNRGFNAVMVDLKDSEGYVTYRSSLDAVAQYSLSAETTWDAAQVTALLEKYGMTPIGRLYAFQDHVAPRTMAGAAVRYMTADGMLWLDDAKENGGRSWLSPGSQTAWQYIQSLMEEAGSLGFETVVLDGVTFPTTSLGIQYAYFGGDADTLSHGEVLSSFVQSMETAAQSRSIRLLLSDAGETMAGVENSYVGANPLLLGQTASAPRIFPGTLSAPFEQAGIQLENPAQDPGAAVTALLGQMQTLAAEMEYLPILQAYDFTQSQIDAQIQSLESLGVEGYILYSPTGSYPS